VPTLSCRLASGRPINSARVLLVGIERKRRELLAMDVSKIQDHDDVFGKQAVIQEISDIVSAVDVTLMPVTRKACLASDFSDQNPGKFEEFVQTHGKLIDDALVAAAHRTAGPYRDALTAFADSIGMLNLSPLNIIDIHKKGYLSQDAQCQLNQNAGIYQRRPSPIGPTNG